MFAAKYEYIFLLSIYLLMVVSIFWNHIAKNIMSYTFWLTMLIFVVECIAIDSYAIYSSWWEFNSDKNIGIELFSLPIEEYVLFVAFYLSVIGALGVVSDK